MAELTQRERIQLLEGIPLFRSLDRDDLETVASLCEDRIWRKGEIVCRAGERGDRFFVVASGELEVWSGGDEPRLLSRLGEGDVLGEIALLADEPRTATVRVARRACLLSLEQKAFQRYLAQNPRTLLHLAQLLGRRLDAASHTEVQGPRTSVLGVVGEPGLLGKSLVAGALAAFLAEAARERVLLVSGRRLAPVQADRSALALARVEQTPVDRLKSLLQFRGERLGELPVTVSDGDEPGAVLRGLGEIVSRLGETFPYVVIDLGGRPAFAGDLVSQVSSRVVEVVREAETASASPSGAGMPNHRVVNAFDSRGLPIPLNHCEPFVLPLMPELRQLRSGEAVERLVADPGLGGAPPLKRLARKLIGSSVGLALGGGAAFGIAHVGVIEAFEREGIPIDLVAGTSMGSIVGIGWAAGLSGSAMHEIASAIGTVPTTLSALDFTLTRPGLLAGNRLVSIFSPLLGPVKRFEQLRHPCRTVALDIESGEVISIGEGLLRDAFRASASVPMLFAPVQRDGRVLVDGAMADPVPATTVREMGADVCIGVNVVPPLKKGVDNALTRMWRRLNHFNPLAYVGQSRDLPNMFDLTMNTIQVLQHELGKYKSIGADLTIVPDLSDFTWIEFYRPDEIIERGALAAQQSVHEVKRLLDERRSVGGFAGAAPPSPGAESSPDA